MFVKILSHPKNKTELLKEKKIKLEHLCKVVFAIWLDILFNGMFLFIQAGQIRAKIPSFKKII